MSKNSGVVIELREDDLYYIGLTDGDKDIFIFYTDTARGAQECATELKRWLEDVKRRKGNPWPLYQIPIERREN